MALENIVTEYIRESSAYKAYVKDQESLINADGLDYYPLSRFVKLTSDKRGGRLFAVVPTEDYAKTLYEDLKDTEGTPIIYVPTDGKQLYSEYTSNRTEIGRKKAQEEMTSRKKGIVIISLRSLVSPFLSEKTLERLTLTQKIHEAFDGQALAEKLTNAGYYRSPNCSEMGTFSLRGEVLDIFPFSGEKPIRIYTEWDEIEKISYFDPFTQKAESSLKEVRISLHSEGQENKVDVVSFSSLMRPADYFIVCGMEKTETSWKAMENEASIRFKEAYKKDPDALLPEKYLFPWKAFLLGLMRGVFLYEISSPENHHFQIEASHSYFGNVSYFKDELSAMLKRGWTVNVVAPTIVQKERLENVLRDYDIEISVSDLQNGFSIPEMKYAAILDQEIFGRKTARRKAVVETVSSPLDTFVSLKPGDYVVHVNYGIGQFEKIDRVKGSRSERDYIKIRYQEGEVLYVPIEQANLVQKYIGNDGRPPKLDSMGGKSWTKKKEQAVKSAQELAAELVKLYAERQTSYGYPFQKDNDWQIQFEASFPFTETPDQLKCIDEIKEDMESHKCMDRLVCGDVGYGKTEIAFRAAFKAVMSGKQVAFLAPTVILAEQHYENFKKRLGDFPVKVGLATRFVTGKEQRKTLEGIKNGTVDVLFGTHKILSKTLAFKDLGLLIVDEEQRFGVKDKEKIKQLKTNIDCLTLSATPIPRTLYMSLLKVRDMSLLTTAPRERLPIETTIGEFDIDQVTAAIKNELSRGGQVFYLHNRVEDIEDVAQLLRRQIPSAIVEFAHGQMDAEELEDRMHRFIYEGVQVLVSTTIIENGIDIPNVNTIIIDRAERLGLAQLYQLRGRVGRSDKKAYCYLFYPDGSVLNDDAVKRLKVLSENTELGSGFKVSMKDMEIRGAGNILGREQSGHLEAVGLDMYLKLLEEEINKLTKANEEAQRDVFLELDYTGFIPDSYIHDPAAKFEMYKRIASIQTESQLEGLKSEAENRFGPIPEEVDNLFCIAEIKIVCRQLKIYHLKEYRGIANVEFSQVAVINPTKVVHLVSISGGRVKLDPKRMDHLTMDTGAVSLKDKALFILETLRRLI
ncbi:MAG: transcription-repair coupling factor [Spirochaetales bacterium]|nr:transcription-repair coupling factor [Candidatus Physcosoma equi]